MNNSSSSNPVEVPAQEVAFDDPYTNRPRFHAVSKDPQNWVVRDSATQAPTLSVRFDQQGPYWIAQVTYGDAINPRFGSAAIAAVSEFMGITVKSWSSRWQPAAETAVEAAAI